jgi:Saxitoxin biosynthesis operon protein SxtJ
VSENSSLHENYSDDEPIVPSSDRAFGCTVGIILIGIGATKVLVTGAIRPVSCLVVAAGALLLSLGILAPSRLSALNKLWLKAGAAIAKVVNPIVLALLFFFVVTPIALFMRIAGKRPLRLAPDQTAASYWISREPSEGEAPTSMRRQF